MDDGLALRNLRISHGERPLLELSLTVAPGQVTTVMGPSGVGKSTLLSAISGHLAPEFSLAGELCLRGRDLIPLRPQDRGIGILFQDHLLFPHLSTGDNLAFGLAPRHRRADRRLKVEEALRQIGLEGYYDRDPATLSGGQKARVALMRMLLAEPGLLLLDEPFSGLDANLRRRVRQMVLDTARDRHLPVLLVTHDHEDAEAAGGPVITLATPVSDL